MLLGVPGSPGLKAASELLFPPLGAYLPPGQKRGHRPHGLGPVKMTHQRVWEILGRTPRGLHPSPIHTELLRTLCPNLQPPAR